MEDGVKFNWDIKGKAIPPSRDKIPSQGSIKDMPAGPMTQPKGPEFDPEDFMVFQGNRDPAYTERWAKKIFSSVDVDGSNFIDKKEMKVMLDAFFTYMTYMRLIPQN